MPGCGVRGLVSDLNEGMAAHRGSAGWPKGAQQSHFGGKYLTSSSMTLNRTINL